MLSWDDPAALTVAQGGTGATSFAGQGGSYHSGYGTDTVSAAAMSSNGQLLIGGTSGPAVATLTAGGILQLPTLMDVTDSVLVVAAAAAASPASLKIAPQRLVVTSLLGAMSIKSVGDVEVIADSDSNTSDSSFTVKNGAGTVLFSVNESELQVVC